MQPSSLSIDGNSPFILAVHADTGNQKLGAYQFAITFDPSMVNVVTALGTQGVEAGADGFITVVNPDNANGTLVVNGFDINGTGPGSDLEVFIIYFQAFNVSGESAVTITVEALADESGGDIGSTSNGTGVDIAITATGGTSSDDDGDGYTEIQGDCDDNNDSVYPGAVELCDTLDNDCNGITNDGVSFEFADISSDYWAEGYISAIACFGISSGYVDNTYRPTNTVTRAQMSAYVIRALEGELPHGYCGTTNPFSDAPYNHWACKYIMRISERGISTGYPDGTYRPENIVNRAEMAVYTIRALYGDSFIHDDSPYFLDVPGSHWAFAYIQRLVEEGISSGYPDGTYRPVNTVNRAEMAAYIARAFLGMY